MSSPVQAAVSPVKTAASHTSQNQAAGVGASALITALVYAGIQKVRRLWPEWIFWDDALDEPLALAALTYMSVFLSRGLAFWRDPTKALRSDATDAAEN